MSKKNDDFSMADAMKLAQNPAASSYTPVFRRKMEPPFSKPWTKPPQATTRKSKKHCPQCCRILKLRPFCGS